MKKIYCKCLNVMINVQDDTRKLDGVDLVGCGAYVSDNSDSFFSNQVFEVELSMGGIELGQSVLLGERVCGDWLVTRCENCRLDTHAVHSVKGTGRVLTSIQLLEGGEQLARMKSSPEYSAIFQIIISDQPDTSSNSPPLSPRCKGTFESAQLIEILVKKYLRRQEDEMNERIRLYTEQQQATFRDLRIQASKEKEKMLSVVTRQYCDGSPSESIFDSMNDSYFGNPTTEKRDLPTDLPFFKVPQKKQRSTLVLLNDHTWTSDIPQPIPNIAQSLPSRLLPAHLSKPSAVENVDYIIKNRKGNSSRLLGTSGSAFSNKLPSLNRPKSKPHATYNDDTLFDLDGFHDSKNVEPFFESDDESSGEATSLESSGGYAIPTRSSGAHDFPGSRDSISNRVYATSVPVGIPLNRRPMSEEEDEDDKHTEAPLSENIAESIKQLAHSIQDSSRSMFGELPRSRFNTMYSYSHR